MKRIARALRAAAVLALALGLAGCSKKTVAPPDPPSSSSALVEQVYPPARSVLIPYDTGIWVQFHEALDLLTVNTDNVFFKLDTRRAPITLQWDATTRRMRIIPQNPLELRHTYTVEITKRLKTASGSVVGDPYFWQFTTNSLRRIAASIPADGATWESPFAMLGWDSTEAAAGFVKYTVWAGTDSAAIAARTAQPIGAPSRGLWIPRFRWTEGDRVFWSIRALNGETGEVADSPLWRFDVLPASTPVDTLDIPVTDWGSWYGYGKRVYCRSTLFAGPLCNNAFYWSFVGVGSGLRLAGQDLVITQTYSENQNQYQSKIFPVTAGYVPCGLTEKIPAAEVLEVAYGTRIGTSQEFRFASDYFAAHIEAMARYGRVWGYTLGSNNLAYHSVGGATLARGVLRLFRYRIPPGAQAASGATLARAQGSVLESPGDSRLPPPGSRLPFARPAGGTELPLPRQ